jgi:hypothetical protein
MSYLDLSEAELREIADMYAIDVEDDASEQEVRNKVSSLSTAEVLLDFPQLADRLSLPEDEDDEEADAEDEDAGLITSDATPKKTAKKAATKKTVAKKVAAKPSTKPSAQPVVGEDKTLLKMIRNNPVYETRGYRFTRNMPYVFVKNEDVDFLIEVEGGFAVAKPSEVESFFN